MLEISYWNVQAYVWPEKKKISGLLIFIFNKSWNTGQVPGDWKWARENRKADTGNYKLAGLLSSHTLPTPEWITATDFNKYIMEIGEILVRITSLKLYLDRYATYYPNKCMCSVDRSSYTYALGLDICPCSSNSQQLCSTQPQSY